MLLNLHVCMDKCKYIFAFTWIKYLDNIMWRLNIDQEPHSSLSMSFAMCFYNSTLLCLQNHAEFWAKNSFVFQCCTEILKSEITWSIEEENFIKKKDLSFSCMAARFSNGLHEGATQRHAKAKSGSNSTPQILMQTILLYARTLFLQLQNPYR